MTHSQTTGNDDSVAPSSPLRQMTDSQSMEDRTPRASGTLAGRKPSLTAISLEFKSILTVTCRVLAYSIRAQLQPLAQSPSAAL